MIQNKPWNVISRSFKVSLAGTIAAILLSLSTPAVCDLVQISPGFDPTTPFIDCLLGPRDSGTESLYLANTARNPLLAVNPGNTDLMVAIMAQDTGFQDIHNPLSNPGNATIAFTKDGGKTWEHKLLPFNFCAGGNVSDQISVQAIRFSPHGGSHGTVLLIGTSQDIRDGLHLPSIGSIFVATTRDLGKSWFGPTVLATGPSYNSFEAEGPTVRAGDTIFDTHNGDIAYATWSTVIAPTTFFGDIFFSRSPNCGKTWKDTQKIYSLVNDFPNSVYAPLGVGQCTNPALAVIKRSGTKVLIDAFLRIYPNNNDCYAQNIPGTDTGITPGSATCTPASSPDSIYDRAIVRSFNEGKTWEEHATVIAQSIFANSFDPRFPPSTGVLTFDNALGTALAVDEKRNIVYAVWQAGHECQDTNLQVLPQIYLSLSKDLGNTWSTPIVVSQTTTFLGEGNCPPEVNPADQAFNANIVVTRNGLVCITYYDFRFFEPYSDDVPTDFWMAVFRPVDGPGTTGVGLDFVLEKRLTPQSFDSGPLYVYPLTQHLNETCCNFTAQPGSFPCNLPTSVLQGIGQLTGLCAHHEEVYTVFGVANTGFNPDLVSIGLPCGQIPKMGKLAVKSADPVKRTLQLVQTPVLQVGECGCFPNNSGTRSCSAIDSNRYTDCLYSLVDLSDLD